MLKIMKEAEILDKVNRGDIKIARLEVIVENHDKILVDIRDSLKEMPLEMKRGFKEIVSELRVAHSDDVELLQNQIDKIKKNPVISYFLWAEEFPKMGRFVAICIIITFVVVFISEFRHGILRLITSLL